MADHCNLCDTRRPSGGTNLLVVAGAGWIEFCPRCASTPIRNADTGEVTTVGELFNRPSASIVPVEDWPEEPFNEYGDSDAIACANGDYNTFEENELFHDRYEEVRGLPG